MSKKSVTFIFISVVTMINLKCLFVTVLIANLLVLLITPVNTKRVIYRNEEGLRFQQNQQQQQPIDGNGTTEEIMKGNIISAPVNCGAGERLDLHNKCRKASFILSNFYLLFSEM